MTAIRLSETKVFVGLLLGGALPWLFSSLSLRAVTRAAGLIVEEVRRQFKIPGVMEGKVKPDYARVVGISTAAAQKELVPLALISVFLPLIVGLVLQVEALGGFLAGIILSGQLLAVFMANAGGAWDNAKKSIEDEPKDVIACTGKGSDRHKAGVVGDTVGDPLKDTAGPALNPMIKVTNLVSLIAAPDHRQVQQDDARPGRRRGGAPGRDRLGHLEEQARGPSPSSSRSRAKPSERITPKGNDIVGRSLFAGTELATVPLFTVPDRRRRPCACASSSTFSKRSRKTNRTPRIIRVPSQSIPKPRAAMSSAPRM
ncbi:MAG: sodium/proton-translocating pyrophosphatase [Sphingobacterium sp.]|nr:sodium/proton-translocating pyrophosphatase [Sphingobacterium sp.]